jgi:hypothetical protein
VGDPQGSLFDDNREGVGTADFVPPNMCRKMAREQPRGSWLLVLDHVPFELLPMPGPGPSVEPALVVDTLGGRVRHRKGVVGVVVHEEPLAAERHDAFHRG